MEDHHVDHCQLTPPEVRCFGTGLIPRQLLYTRRQTGNHTIPGTAGSFHPCSIRAKKGLISFPFCSRLLKKKAEWFRDHCKSGVSTPPPEWKITAAEALFRNFCYLERVWTCRVKVNVGRNCPCTRGNEADFASKHDSLLPTKSVERYYSASWLVKKMKIQNLSDCPVLSHKCCIFHFWDGYSAERYPFS